ncbi:AzlC family ABC transporter permease [Allorhizobium undicola]|uniref:AzlC family ABC transporter permease n=1 Tax=Allorhizobium undicola TaxID=78527 RepID=UPI0004875D9F|nr:AzlC family ABC transporter permease [Allorhizobium undicola]
MSDFFKGARQSIPVGVSTLPFAILYGAIAATHGHSTFEATLTSAALFAGASQLVGIELFSHNVPAWLIVLSIFAVNFRHILYSAAAGPYFSKFSPMQKLLAFFMLTDPQFAEMARRSETPAPVSFSWYMGFALAIYLPWVGFTAVGTLFSSVIGDPKALGLDVLLPLYFMGSLLGFRRRPKFLPVAAASAIASIIAIKLVGSPWHVSIGALAGIVTAALLPVTPKYTNPQPMPPALTEAAE